MPPTLSSRRPTAASRTLAEQFQPIVTLRASMRESTRAPLDVARAQARLHAGRHAFDAHPLLQSVGDLTRPFGRMAAALERTGIASASQLLALRESIPDPMEHVLSWANGESMPRDPVLRLARTVAGLLGNAILSRAAEAVSGELAISDWKRTSCPCCGASPDLALATDKRRTLVCWRCDTMWRTDRRGCLGCDADSAPTLVRIPSPSLGYDLTICNACGRYLKERRGAPTHALIVERALTAGLDEAAEQRGLRA